MRERLASRVSLIAFLFIALAAPASSQAPSDPFGGLRFRFVANLPTTRYDDILVHPRTKVLILGTHGRSIWILDDASPLAEWRSTVASAPLTVFPIRATTLFQYCPARKPASADTHPPRDPRRRQGPAR